MRKVLVALVMILALTGLAWAQTTEEPSLAEMARKVRAERAKKKGTKVTMFTNDSVAQAGGTVSTVGEATPPAAAEGAAQPAEGAPAAEGAAAGAAAGGEAAGGEKECDEQCWRGKFREQRAKITTAQKELDILQREFSLARTQYSSDPNQAMRDQYSNTTAGGRELQEKQNQINAKTAEIQQAQRGLADLEDQLRRAGGKPDWARE